MSNSHEIERGDMIATKDGKTLRVLSVYKSNNDILRVEGVDDTDESPKRLSVFPDNIIRILRKAVKPAREEVKI